jgi:hypothetical protein
MDSREEVLVNASLPVAPLLCPVFVNPGEAKVFEEELEPFAGIEPDGDDVGRIGA